MRPLLDDLCFLLTLSIWFCGKWSKKVSDKRLIIEPGGGLGNRLLAISSAYNLAKDCGISDITLLWRNNNECGCDFEDVLSTLPIPSRVITMHFGKESYKFLLKRRKIGSVVYKYAQGIIYKAFRAWTKLIQIPTRQGMCLDEQKMLKKYVLEMSRNTVYIEAYYSFYGEIDLTQIAFESEIVKKVMAYRAIVGSYDAMHIRRTDNAMAIENSPTELFYQKIEELVAKNVNHKIYIATDDENILYDLKEKYPQNILSEAMCETSRTSSVGMKFALFEMLILAGAETLYASFGSTFTIIANAVGGNEMVVLKK